MTVRLQIEAFDCECEETYDVISVDYRNGAEWLLLKLWNGKLQ